MHQNYTLVISCTKILNISNADYIVRGLRQMRGNIGEYIIFIIPSYTLFSKLNMFNNTPIIIDEIGKVKNQQAYTIVVL